MFLFHHCSIGNTMGWFPTILNWGSCMPFAVGGAVCPPAGPSIRRVHKFGTKSRANHDIGSSIHFATFEWFDGCWFKLQWLNVLHNWRKIVQHVHACSFSCCQRFVCLMLVCLSHGLQAQLHSVRERRTKPCIPYTKSHKISCRYGISIMARHLTVYISESNIVQDGTLACSGLKPPKSLTRDDKLLSLWPAMAFVH